MTLPVDGDALLCALVLVPRTFSRNRFFTLFEHPEARRIRRRAGRVRSVVRQLTGQGKHRAEVIGQQELADGQMLLRYRIPALALERTTALSPLEAATVRYARARAGQLELADADRDKVTAALARLSQDLQLEPSSLQ